MFTRSVWTFIQSVWLSGQFFSFFFYCICIYCSSVCLHYLLRKACYNEHIRFTDLVSMGTAGVWVWFHSDKFAGNWVERNGVPVLGSYSFYHLVSYLNNLRQFKNGPNLPEAPRDLGLKMRTRTTGSRSRQIKRMTMEPNDNIIDMNSCKTNS